MKKFLLLLSLIVLVQADCYKEGEYCHPDEPCPENETSYCDADMNCICGEFFCTTNSQCIDSNPCTEDFCIPPGFCFNPPISECCVDDNDCAECEECLSNTCESIPDCCVNDVECADSDVCTDDDCVENECQNTPIPNCCVVDADCPEDSNVCVAETCIDNRCHFQPIPGCTIGIASSTFPFFIIVLVGLGVIVFLIIGGLCIFLFVNFTGTGGVPDTPGVGMSYRRRIPVRTHYDDSATLRNNNDLRRRHFDD